MTVIELARRTGVTPAVVRFYAQAGVLPPHSLAGGGRGYDESDALKLGLAIGLHRLGIVFEGGQADDLSALGAAEVVGEAAVSNR